ncbi:MAG: hypothetical protein DRI90_23995 [Deltaproteobacteria bacterium]|nr:MAG: hypothetical protein DRI90_23995 [Deltaproteobacteria bacterium]
MKLEMVRWAMLGLMTVVLACGGDSDDGSSQGGNTSTGGSGGSDCPPECFAPNMCVSACGEMPTDYGCCPCPSGTINELTCTSNCGLVGTPCPGEGDCGNGLTCTGSVCAPDGAMCAPPPGGVGCGAGAQCLVISGTQAGICVTAEAQVCLCDGGGSFDC